MQFWVHHLRITGDNTVPFLQRIWNSIFLSFSFSSSFFSLSPFFFFFVCVNWLRQQYQASPKWTGKGSLLPRRWEVGHQMSAYWIGFCWVSGVEVQVEGEFVKGWWVKIQVRERNLARIELRILPGWNHRRDELQRRWGIGAHCLRGPFMTSNSSRTLFFIWVVVWR